MSCSVPISPFAASIETSFVFGRSALRSSSGSMNPSLSGVSSVTATPYFSSRMAGTTIDLCSIAEVMR